MTDKVQKIHEEIKMVVNRRLNLLNGDYFNLIKETDGFTNEIMDIIDTMQEEPVSEKKCIFTKDSYTDEDRKVLCEDCKEKCSKKEEPVSKELEEAASKYAKSEYDRKNPATLPDRCKGCYAPIVYAFKAGAQWQKENLWKPADGDDLPEIDRDVICLLDCGKVVKAHRPSKKDNLCVPETYGKGGWSYPNIKYWFDVELPKEIEL